MSLHVVQQDGLRKSARPAGAGRAAISLFLGTDWEIFREVIPYLDVIPLILQVKAGGMLKTIERVLDINDVAGASRR